MEKTAESLSPDEVLALLKGPKPTILNEIREAHPEWTPSLPTPRSFDFKRTNLSQLNLRHMDLSGIDFSWADLQHAALDHADCSRSNFTGANLQGITLVGTQFHPVVGLFGHNRALYAPFSKSFSSGAELATFSERGDHVQWSLLRSISTFRVFGASYITIAVLVSYAS
jgi:hypothetical protein